MSAGKVIAVLSVLMAAPARADPPPSGPYLDEAFRVAQGAMASQAGNALMQIGVRAAAGSGGLSALMRDRQGITTALDAIEDRLTLPGADTVALTGEGDALQQQLAGVDARGLADYPEFRALTRPRPLSVAALQALLAPDEALVLTFVGDHSTYVFAVSKTSAGWHRLAVERAEVARIVSELRDELDPSGAARSAEALVPVTPGGLSFNRHRVGAVRLSAAATGATVCRSRACVRGAGRAADQLALRAAGDRLFHWGGR